MKNKPEARVRVLVTGIVQGIYFRQSTVDNAMKLGLVGFVKNNANGQVEAIFEGNKKTVESMISWCHEGPIGSRVEKVELEWEEPTGQFESFDIWI